MKVVALLAFVAVVCAAQAVSARQVKVGADGLVLTPFGRHHSDCVHHVPDGATVDNEDDHIVVSHPSFRRPKRIPRCGLAWPKPGVEAGGFDDDDADGDGWQAYVEQKVHGEISGMYGKWTVPPEPQQEAQTLFTFTGLQNINWVPPNPQPSAPFDIIQPVLQYGSSSAGAFDAWSIASWYVTLGSDVVYSTLKKIKAGGQIYGNMTRLGPDSWYIDTVDLKSGTHSNMTITRSILKSQPWAYVTLEVYDVSDCEQFPPAGTKMPYTELELVVGDKLQPFKWQVGTAGQKPPTCGASIDILSPSEVTITW